MKIKLYLKLAKVNLLRRRKKNTINILITTIALILLTLTICISNGLNNFIQTKLLNTVDFKTLIVETGTRDDNKEKIYEKLNNHKDVIKIYPWISNNGGEVQIEKNQNLTKGEIFLKPALDKISPNIVKGNGISENSKNVALIPTKFSVNHLGYEVGLTKEKTDFLNGEDFIGEYITLKYKIYNETGHTYGEYKFKVIGVYDPTTTFDTPDTFYIPYSDLLDLNTSFQKETNVQNMAVVVNKYENLNNIKSIIEKEKFNVVLKSELGDIKDISLYIKIIGFSLLSLTLVISIFNIISNTLESIRERMNEIGILKTVGYLNLDILKCFSIETLFISSLSVLLNLIISGSLLLIIKFFSNKFLTIYFADFKIDINDFILSNIICIILGITIPILSSLISLNKILKIQPTKLTKV
ncbi:ABC transporter permease [Bacillus toyonensis]|uniref:ABC transporter permease n=1 Tax=Bacillus toyonensis TaxID=155322 RepID=UPI0009A634DE|nr:FtsX-like permease family protein [Bacillus toyonensis]SLK20422.1 putative ABC transport system permease protein [Bacillus toyonensis]